MSDLPRITVVTICRNVLPALRRTVASIQAQDYPALEYWIVDGGSTDGTVEFLATLAPLGIRTVSGPDRGISDAMNKGLRLATGEWVAHLHADDTYLPGALDAAARAMRPGVDFVCGAILKEEPRGEVVCPAAPERLAVEMAIGHPAVFARRAVLDGLGGFDVTLRNAMDYDLFLRARKAGATFVAIPDTLTRVAGGGQSERSLWKTLAETHAIRRRHLSGGWSRSRAFLWFLYAKGRVRMAMQDAGLDGLVAWYRRTLAIPRKR
jgi:glycosyltransferase involved in cell wall biosynthesis